MKVTVVRVYKAYYMSVLNTLPEDKRAFLDDDIEADNYYLVFKGLPVGGFATRSDGYLTGLFALNKGLGKTIFTTRLQYASKDKAEGVKQLEIFCTGDYLKDFYSNYGFEVMEVTKWDDNYAPAKWDYAKFGRPNLYTMIKKV